MGGSMSSLKLFLVITVVAFGMAISGARADAPARTGTIILAGGCFWCVEADFDKVEGVVETISGFTGGHVDNPSYRQVVGGGTGHREAVLVRYDSDVTDYRTLLDLFWRSIDPTDAGGQFCDRGEPYTTAVFVQSGAERRAAEASRTSAQAALGQTIVTPILDAAPFFVAEDYHQGYWQSRSLIPTRFGLITKAEAYKRYRDACGRNARLRELWGNATPFAGG
ncbi:MAG: peptide-methionine (S)-S-oxide reductase MsrA [Rhodobacteraceae bacterium]|nr:peptide-methionine (S)-S-oxide reductase MsrA [Paracoccaceae bacterium]